MDYEEISDRIQSVWTQRDKLPGRSREFIEDQHQRDEQWGDRLRMSPKQLKWLNDLYDEVNRADLC